jgi:hypothetical protein
VVILLLLVAAFSTATTNAPARRALPIQPLSACALVTRADVEDALGRQFGGGSEETDGRASTCDYSTKTGLVSFTVQRLTAKPNLAYEVAALKKEMPEGVIRAAGGLGDAFYFDLPGAGTQLHIVDGSSVHLMISILGFGEAPLVSEAAARIAGKALRRL